MRLFVDILFNAEVIHWRGPSPFHFVVVPDEYVGEIRHAARLVSYGWGMVPADVEIGGHRFKTAMFARDETYFVPLRDAVRRAAGIALGERVDVALRIRDGD